MHDNEMPDQFLPTADAAKLVGLSEATLATDRVTGRLNIPFHKFGAAVRYSRSDLIEWARRHRREASDAA